MFQNYLLFAISVITTVGAHLCFKKGVLKLGEINLGFSQILPTIWQIMQNTWILFGAVLFGVSFLTWLLILSKLQLNVAYPIIISIEAVLVSILAWFVFHESLTLIQIAGIILVILGIILISPKGGL